MQSLWRALFGLLIALSLGMGAVAHAGESPDDSPISGCVEDAGHDRGGEPQGGDVDKWGVHAHGGCHGHHQADALSGKGGGSTPPVRVLDFAKGEDFLPQLVPDANLRPPIA